MLRSHRFLIKSHKNTGNQDAPHPSCLFVAPKVCSQSGEPKFLPFIVSHHPPPSLLTSSAPLPSPLFSLLSVNPPRPDYEVGENPPLFPSSFTPIKFTVRKGGRRGRAVVETSISDNCFWQVEQVSRRI